MYTSLPSWERGLKSVSKVLCVKSYSVAPFVGAWIEIRCIVLMQFRSRSLPSWERGLKLHGYT